MRRSFLLSLVLCCLLPGFAVKVFATHNRAGEIIYRHVQGFTYEVTVITVTKSSALADRPYLKIRWGDEASNLPDDQLDSLARALEQPISGMDGQRNEYYGTHTYAGPGIFFISVTDPNRNSDVQNIAGSVLRPFCIQSELVISPEMGHNNSVVLLYPPNQRACIYQPWIHNPTAFDPDGDSLVYSLVPCLGAPQQPLDGWESPESATLDPSDILTIDSQTGEINWIVPTLAGEFNIAILIEEFRNGIFVGSVLRDMQIEVITCNNQPPAINPLPDLCIEAGATKSFSVYATDPNGNLVVISAFGGPLTQVENEAEWNSSTNTFSWSPECEEVRNQPYSVSFQALDNGFVPLADIETVNILVVAPRVENPEATASGNSILLQWDITPCASIFDQATAPQVRYKIYRKGGMFGFDPDECELGVPSYTGYQWIADVEGVNTNTYLDNDVFYGGTYCYMIVTCFPDGALSYASEEFCSTIKKDLPVITKVSIGTTNVSTGIDTVWWSPPVELDTLIFPGPYQYKLFYGEGFFSSTPDMIYESSVSSTLTWGDTTFIHTGINTQATAHSYDVKFYSNGEWVSSSGKASSPYLQLTPNDNQIELNILTDIPWINYLFHIFRKGPDESSFAEIGTSETPHYIDDSLENNLLYCYKVFIEGTYNATLVPDPLFNWSQEACALPYDQTPPCAPELVATASCSNEITTLQWNNPDHSCAEDVTGYNIYYSATEGGAMEWIASFASAEDTVFVFNEDGKSNSIAGCFTVTALDSLNLWPDGQLHQNESSFSNKVCVDNCPVYFLPNVFSPNGDGKNDLFIPFDFRFVRDVDFRVFNRWGVPVFETTNPEILWNGTNKDTGEIITDGVYYYTITVNTIRLTGIQPEKFSGSIQVINSKQPLSSE
ncbi:MAG: gliding motility-associated C-terminal domain-containing protein [Crocinitomicaceae bacterium]|nr:gliding motility-associated C-terminal domain-containing protein [Crocinitomicaceae bacterium]